MVYLGHPLSNLSRANRLNVRLRALASSIRKTAMLSALLVAVPATALSQAATNLFAGTTVVGQTSSAITVSVTLTTAGTASSATAITQGATISDFTVSDGGTCVTNQTFNAGQTCTVSVVFNPHYPGVRRGAVKVTDSSNTVLGVAQLAGNSTGSLSVLVPGVINTVAGDTEWIYRADGVAATAASIFLPAGITEDAAGNLYISDTNNNRVRRVDAQTGLISTIAGTGTPAFSGDGGAATSAEVSLPGGILLDGAGDVYFADTGNQCVRRIDAFSGVITTVAGTGGHQGYTGDNGPATAALLTSPAGLALDAQGNLYIADSGNNVIRKVNASTGVITTVAGTGPGGDTGDGGPATQAKLATPNGVFVGSDNSIYIADLNNNRIRKVSTSGTISTIAGNGVRGFSGDGSSPTSAELNAPAAVVLDPAGNIYIGDSGNNCVREIAVGGSINTIAGNGSEQFTGDGGPATQAGFYDVDSIFFDQNGNLLIADSFHNRIRTISGTTIPLQYPVMRVGKTSTPQLESVVDDGNAALNISSLPLSNALLDSATTTCSTSSALAIGSSCVLGIEFNPQTVGANVQGTVTVNSDAANSSDVVDLFGQVLSVNPTAVALTSSQNPSLINTLVTFTATISSSDTTLGGTVAFLDGTANICSAAPVVSGNVATCSTSALTLGQHTITASYTGDTDNAASTSPTLTQIVKQAAQVVLTASPNPATVTTTVTLTVTATAANGTPTGTVTFLDGTTILGTGNLNSSGVATFSTSQLTPGAHSLSVSYPGDTTTAAGTSNTVSETISQATTVTTLASSNASATVGTSVSFTATISSSEPTSPTGTVQFTEAGVLLGSAPLSNGTATVSLPTLMPGPHQIVASYSGDTDDAASSSSAFAETILQIGTVTAISAAPSTASAGAVVQFTATINMVSGAVADGAITGQVTFTDSGTTIGTGTVGSSGTATFSSSTLSVGAHSIAASFGGNTNYAASSSSALTETVNATPTTTTLATSGNALAGKPVILTATVTTGTGVPTGVITFEDGGTSIGQATLNGQGIATLSISSLAAGGHSLVAIYGGDANYLTSSSMPQTEVISLATTTLSLNGTASPMDAGLTASFTVTLTSNGIAPTGSLTLRDGTAVISTQTVTAAGSFTFTVPNLAIGSHSLTASYSGDTDNATATSNNFVLVVQQAPTNTALQTSQSPQLLGQSVTLTAAVTSVSPNISGTINFLDGTTVLGSAPVGSTGTATLSTTALTFGQHTLTAVYSGDTNHVTSTSSAVPERIVESAQISLSSSNNPATSGTNVTFTVKIAGNGSIVPSGSVSFMDGSSVLTTATLDASGAASFSTTSLSVGSHSIAIAYAGDTNYAAASSTVLLQTITNANTQIALTSSANPATYSNPLTFKAVVTSNGGTATGPITFTDSGTAIGTGVLDNTGTATLTLSTLPPGAHTIIANYAGDGRASASVSIPLSLVVRQNTTVSVAPNGNPILTLSSVTFTASVTNAGQNVATGTITFTDGAVQLGVVTLDPTGKATLTLPSMTAGNHSILASYSGDSTNFASNSNPITETVQLRPTTTTLTSTTDPNNNQQVTLIAVVQWSGSSGPTGTISFTSPTATLGTANVDSTGVATLVIIMGSNPQTLTASYSGDNSYTSSSSPATLIAAELSKQISFNLNPPTMSIPTKQHSVGSITLTSLSNFSDTMQFGCLGLPFAATCTFSSNQVNLKAGATATVQVTVDTGNPLGAGAQASNTHAASSRIALCFIPGALLLCLGLRRSRQRKALKALCLLIMMGAALWSTTGCSGLQQTSTPVGTYTFQVTVSGLNTGISESQTMTLTVTE